VGKEVITHTDAVSVPGWSGAGYIIFDPQTGSGAYKIGGGQNGSYLKYVRDNLDRLLFWLSELSQSLVNVAGGVLARTLTSAIQSIQLTITFINLILSDRCPLSVAITGVVSISVFVGQATVLIGAATAAGSAVNPFLGGVVGFGLGLGASLIAGEMSRSFSQRCN